MRLLNWVGLLPPIPAWAIAVRGLLVVKSPVWPVWLMAAAMAAVIAFGSVVIIRAVLHARASGRLRDPTRLWADAWRGLASRGPRWLKMLVLSSLAFGAVCFGVGLASEDSTTIGSDSRYYEVVDGQQREISHDQYLAGQLMGARLTGGVLLALSAGTLMLSFIPGQPTDGTRRTAGHG